MSHLSDEQLVNHFYGWTEAGTVAQHLDTCPECASAYQALQEDLAVLGRHPVPEPDTAFETRTWARVNSRLGRQDRVWSAPRWAMLAAAAVVLVAVFLAGRLSSPAVPEKAEIADNGEVRERILLVAVGDHLERSQMVLVELANAPRQGTVDISGERLLAEELLGANRLYRQAAATTGDTGMAEVLDELERMLVEIAHSPDEASPKELEALRSRLEAQGILFKIRAFGTQVREREALPSSGGRGL
jgi:hypothetical protein